MKIRKLTIILLFITLIPVKIYSAELLQITDSNKILVGDQNRALSINLYCTEIDERDDKKAVDILKRNFPRGTKVKIKPYSSSDNKLFAKIYKTGSDVEMTDLLDGLNLVSDNCND
tara:strand:- start:351 stop:698 length:348 start_codon:yes stop_codon:yes gene_type:complete